METNALIGLALILLAVGFMCGLVIWSARSISRISRRSLTTVRTIVKDRRNE